MRVSALVYIAAFALADFLSSGSQLAGEKSLLFGTRSACEKRQGSFHGRTAVLVPLLARFQGGGALGSELKGLWHGPGALSSYPRWKGRKCSAHTTGDAVGALSIC